MFASPHHWDTKLELLFESAECMKFFWEKDAVSEKFEINENPLTPGQKFSTYDT